MFKVSVTKWEDPEGWGGAQLDVGTGRGRGFGQGEGWVREVYAAEGEVVGNVG